MAHKFKASPHFSKGRGKSQVTHVVIHSMSGFFSGTEVWFMNPVSKVSAHYLVSKQGDVLQMVKEEDRAWHVGKANPFCIGIELEDASFYIDAKTGKKKLKGACPPLLIDPNWFTINQLDVTAALVADILHRYKLPVSQVIGHNDPLMRQHSNNHTDPGDHFPWTKFRGMVQQKLDVLKGVKKEAPKPAGKPKTEPKK